MMHIQCDDCNVEWTTKGGGHRRFYRYRNPDGSRNYSIDMLPMGAGYEPAEGEWDGIEPTICVIKFGPYSKTTAQSRDLWEGIRAHITAMTPDQFWQLACPHPHDRTIVLSDDGDPSHGL